MDRALTEFTTIRIETGTEMQRLKRNLKFVKKADDLGTAICDILETSLERELKNDENIMTAEDMEDIANQLPPLSQVLVPDFFNCVTYPLRMIPSYYSSIVAILSNLNSWASLP